MKQINGTRLLLWVFLMLFSFYNFAQVPYNAWWQKANRFYQQKSYDSAAIYYEKLAAYQPQSAAIFYNLGNCYYKLNRIGPAVLNYERALKINPGFKEAQDNLELTKSRITNRIQQPQDIFFVQWWKNITKASLAEMWAIVSWVLFLIVLSFLILRKWNRTPSWVQPQLAVITFIVFLCAIIFSYVSASKKHVHNRAVVMDQDAPLRADRKTQKIQVLIPEGTVLKIETEQAGWVNVKLPDGRSGWMQKESLERI